MDVSWCHSTYFGLPVYSEHSTVPQFWSSASKKPVPAKDSVLAGEPGTKAIAPQAAMATKPLPQTTPASSDSTDKEMKPRGKGNKASKEKANGSGKR